MKTRKLIYFFPLLFFVLFYFSRGEKKNETEISNEFDLLLKEKPISKIIDSYEIDFTKCDPEDSKKFADGPTTTILKIIGIEEENRCRVQTTFTAGGNSYSNNCIIPIEIGSVLFEGSNFDAISSYCTISW